MKFIILPEYIENMSVLRVGNEGSHLSRDLTKEEKVRIIKLLSHHSELIDHSDENARKLCDCS